MDGCVSCCLNLQPLNLQYRKFLPLARALEKPSARSLARNQYINNSPGIFSCIRAGANTGATCIRPEIISLKNLANMQKMTPQKYFPVFARVRIQAPHVFAKKLIPKKFFPHVLVLCRGVVLLTLLDRRCCLGTPEGLLQDFFESQPCRVLITAENCGRGDARQMLCDCRFPPPSVCLQRTSDHRKKD